MTAPIQHPFKACSFKGSDAWLCYKISLHQTADDLCHMDGCRKPASEHMQGEPAQDIPEDDAVVTLEAYVEVMAERDSALKRVAELEALVGKLADALKLVEWGFEFRRCSLCAGWNCGPNGETDRAHTKDCKVAAALSEARSLLGKEE
jgi:hypothetical protein